MSRDHAIHVETKFSEYTIEQATISPNGDVVQQVIRLQDEGVRDALVKLGWTPPGPERDALLADRDRLAAELAKSSPSCDRCQSSHCCSVAGTAVPPLCVTDPDGSLPLWMPWTNEDVRKRLDAAYAQVDRLTAELARVRRNHLRRMEQSIWPMLDRHYIAASTEEEFYRKKRRRNERAGRLFTAIRAALAQTQDGTTEGRA